MMVGTINIVIPDMSLAFQDSVMVHLSGSMWRGKGAMVPDPLEG
jgi:hypothetical protein